jgi:hypothetical protein
MVHKVNYNFDERLKRIAEEEYKTWLTRQENPKKESTPTFSLQEKPERLDSIANGSLGVKFGAEIALPFYAQFHNSDEAMEYCRKRLEPFEHRGKIACILWDSPVGRQLIATFVLSEGAKRFLIARDLSARENYWAIASRPITWSCFTTFFSVLTYVMHRYTRSCGGFVSFFVVYAIMMSFAMYSASEYHKLYQFLTDHHADAESAALSEEHFASGKEYYCLDCYGISAELGRQFFVLP